MSAATARLRVLLADDHAVVRHGLRALLEQAGCMEVVGECGDGESAVAAYLALRPDVLLLDLRMPRSDGLEVARRVLAADAAARILILTTCCTDQAVQQALRIGARGYLLKDAAPEVVCAAIRRVASGGMAMAADAIAQCLQAPARSELSPRERQVLHLLGTGQPNKEIARQLALELSTVKGHVKSLLAKLGARNRTEALAEATRRGLVAG